MMKVIIENLLTRFSHFGRCIGREYFGEGSRKDNKAVGLHVVFLFRLSGFFDCDTVGALYTTICNKTPKTYRNA